MSLFSVFYFMLYSVFSRQYPVLLEQSCNLSSSVYIDTLCCRNFRQTWHGHDVTGQGYDEACTCGDFQVTYGNFESGRCAEFGLIIGQAVLGFCHTDRAAAVAHCLKLFCLLLRICCQDCSLAAINLLYNLVDLLLDRAFQLIAVSKVVRLLAQTDDFLCELDSAFAALCPYFRQCYIYAKLFALGLYKVKLCLRVSNL